MTDAQNSSLTQDRALKNLLVDEDKIMPMKSSYHQF